MSASEGTSELPPEVADPGNGSDLPAAVAEEPTIGWLRAIATALAVLIVGFFGAVVGANAILTKSLALTRTAREWLATALFLAVIIVLAVVLRLLQRRGLI